MSSLVENAKAYAIKAHGQQRYGESPYEVHLARVHGIVQDSYPHNSDIQAAAWLHDVLEDTDVTILDLGALFGTNVAIMVWNVTGVGANRREKFESIVRKISRLTVFPDIRNPSVGLKLADRIANVRSCIESNDARLGMYVREWPAFRDSLQPLGGSARLWSELEKTMLAAEESSRKPG